jgi:hypothetical protein
MTQKQKTAKLIALRETASKLGFTIVPYAPNLYNVTKSNHNSIKSGSLDELKSFLEGLNYGINYAHETTSFIVPTTLPFPKEELTIGESTAIICCLAALEKAEEQLKPAITYLIHRESLKPFYNKVISLKNEFYNLVK